LPQKNFYEFGAYRIDPALGRLERAGETIAVPPKAFDLLLLLARNHHRVVSKAELIQALWPETFVEEANLTQHVYTLRKALGEGHIETVPRRGYRLAAEVREVATVDEAPEATGLLAEGERRQATVLHCGLANAAALAERLGLDGLQELMATLTGLASEEIDRFEGVLLERHPDRLVALFGARVVHEDDARRALLAALGIRRRLPELRPPAAGDEEPPLVRVALHTGPVVVSRRAGDRGPEYSAVGDTLRTGELLEQLADPDAVLISEATRRLVEGYVEAEPAAVDATVTGVAAFRVVGLAPRPKRILAEFVGRRHELALLADLAALAASGRGQVVGVVGEPGMGKSRLVHELANALPAGGAVALLEGRCVSYGSLVPYLPLADLVRAYCAFGDGDAPEDVRRAVDRAVRESDLPADAAPWLLRVVGIASGTPGEEAMSPEAIKSRTFEVLRMLLLKVSARRPLVVVVEDVHWIDRTSEEFMTALAERIMAARVMLVATFRPGYRAAWMDRSYVTQITLTPLSAADGTRLVDSVARERPLPEGVSAAILAKAEGNPFFLEELARTVVERGPEAHGIPDTVHGVIMARVDRLPAVAKRLLQTASVLGREVPPRLLGRMYRGADLEVQLALLCRLEFLYERPGADEPVFVFKHALTQDVAYDSLLARVRRDLHLEAARALEELYGERVDEIAPTLAYHYARTDAVDQAVTWLIRAADQGARVYANAEAVLHLDLARRRLERFPEGAPRDRRIIEVALRHAHSLYFLGRFAESIEVLLPHEARLARLGDTSLTAAYTFWLAHMYSRLGDQRRAGESAHRAIEAATRAGDQATLGKAHGLLALEGHWSGDTTDGITHGEESVRLLASCPDQRWWLGMSYFYLAMNHMLAGRFEAALAETARADGVGQDIGDPRLQTYAAFTAGWVETTRGNHDAAIAACSRALAQAPDRVSRAYASMLLGQALLENGQVADALVRLNPVVTELEGFAFPQWQGLAGILIGEAARRECRLEEADTRTRRGIEAATRARYWYAVGIGERVAGRIARDRGRAAEGLAALDRAASTFDGIGAAFEAGRTRLEAAEARRLAARTGTT
jgi:DNA-binding winged helix-turn-helix (wHTH) protein/tetratricopeptide (TPR) repeat protein